jgi:peptidoglycan hydrolase-like protein with peptidoglycan-binding domain
VLSYSSWRRTWIVIGSVVSTSSVLAAPAMAARSLGSRVLRQGMSGHDVRVLQGYLTLAGFKTPIDGSFGPITFSNVKRFERKYHLHVDGVVTRTIARDLRLAATVAKAQAVAPAAPAPLSTSATPTATPTATPAAVSGTGGATINEVPAPGDTSSPVGTGTLNPDGTASPPANAPTAIQLIFAAGNKIASAPYVYGGGHASFTDTGYDCSGSVSYALHGGGMLSSPLDSTQFETWGNPGPGHWITIYSNSGHVYMTIAGLRYDTAAQGDTGGSRWTDQSRSSSGYVVTHPPGW